ncbi:MAG: hypothetical protein AAF682_25285 [Planctomycetota bacterium]
MNQVKHSLVALGAGLLASAASGQSFTTVGTGGAARDWAVNQDNILISGSPDYIYVVSTGTTIPIGVGGDSPVALADSGQVLGETPDLSGPDTSGIWIPDAWTSLGGIATSGCPDLSSPYDLSDDGMVATGLGWEGCSGRAYKWTPGTGMVALGQIGPNSARGNVVSGDGSTIGGWDEDDTGPRRASIWYSDGTELLVNVTGTNPTGIGEVWGLSTDGSWACGSSQSGEGPFLYSQATGNINLGLPGPLGIFDVSQANGVSDDGKVVVGIQGSAFGTPPRAFIWTATGGMRWLDEYLTDLGVTLPGGAGLSSAVEVSPDGTKILGTYDMGPFSPQNAFIAEIPAQPSWEQYGTGLGGVNSLDLDGGGTTAVGGVFDATTSGITFTATFSATGLSAAQSSFPLFGGTGLINPGQLFATVTGSPGGTGSVTNNIPIPSDPDLFGLTVYLQSLTDDLSQPQLFALSNGLAVTICL